MLVFDSNQAQKLLLQQNIVYNSVKEIFFWRYLWYCRH